MRTNHEIKMNFLLNNKLQNDQVSKKVTDFNIINIFFPTFISLFHHRRDPALQNINILKILETVLKDIVRIDGDVSLFLKVFMLIFSLSSQG